MTFHIVKITFYVLICFASVTSNAVLITILLRFEHLRTTANLFVLNLALCDVATVLLGIPFTIGVEESYSYPFGKAGCKILMPAATAAFNSAAFTLLAIAIDRFYAIMFPMRARLQSCKKKSFVLCLLHGLSFASVVPFSIHQRYVKNVDKHVCIEVWPEGGSRIYTLALFCIQYALPLTLIAILYSVSWNEIRKKNKVIIEMQEVQQRGKCHFSRSQSWDAAMRRHDSSSLPMGNTSKGTEKVVIKSTSNYSFKSNYLEAVEEGSNYEPTDNTQDDDETVTREETPIINSTDIANQNGVNREEQKKFKKRNQSSSYWSGKFIYRSKKPVQSGPSQKARTAVEARQLVSTEDSSGVKRFAISPAGSRASPIVNHFKRDKKTKILKLCKPISKRNSRRKTKDDGLKGSSENTKMLGQDAFSSTENNLKSVCPQAECEGQQRRPTLLGGTERMESREETNYSTGQGAIKPTFRQKRKVISMEGCKQASEAAAAVATSTRQASGMTNEESKKQIVGIHQEQSCGQMLGQEPGMTSQTAVSQDVESSDASKMKQSASSPAISSAGTQSQRRRESMPAAWQKSTSQQEVRATRFSQKKRLTQVVSQNSNESMSVASIKRMKQTRRTLRMFTCVVVVFAICMLPNQITWIWMAFNGAHLNHILYTVFYFLTYTNSVINPWIYGAVNPSFRRAYSKIFFCKSNQNLTRRIPTRSSSKLSFLWLGSRTSDANTSTRHWNSKKSLIENVT